MFEVSPEFKRLSLEHHQIVVNAIQHCSRQGGKVYAWLHDLEAVAESMPHDGITWELRGWPSSYIVARGVERDSKT